MDGWTVAFILYLIPVLVGMISAKDKEVRDPFFLEVILWPPLMLIGALMLWLRERKK